ncbi:hypothetical protein L7F22_021020 [Adiantum nelumboides]|nr:hypothetical protein [Adiantum nelumboides]
MGALPVQLNTGVIKMLHKKGPKEVITNWRPLTMLNSAYKIFAKAIALRISPALTKWLSSEQKGFIKGQRIMEAVIAMWEGIEYAEESGQDFVFVKVDFDKAYDRLEWSFIIESLTMLAGIVKFVSTLLGNAQVRVAINNGISDPFPLNRSVRQGCPLAPLLFSISVDSLNWLIKSKLTKAIMQGITLPDGRQQCLSQFADGTNGLLHNDEQSLQSFWECLHIFCTASGSRINHAKTGIRASLSPLPRWITNQGCSILQDGVIFRLLGIPFGFRVSMSQR